MRVGGRTLGRMALAAAGLGAPAFASTGPGAEGAGPPAHRHARRGADVDPY
jgi:hypothetical protein